MKYIKKVNLVNFQSHKDTTIEFDKGLNIIVGASDSGKTSILRGIKWALYNDPSGDYFIREGESECSVTLYFSDMTKIKRYRNKSKNTYFIYDKDDNEEKYEGFGTSVPDEVLNITGIKKILLDKDTSKSINISDQLEGAFLLSEKNSVKANSIGYLVGVDLIDDTLRETLRDSRQLSNQQKNIDADIVKLEEELLAYDYLDEVIRKIKSMDKIRNIIKNKEISLNLYKKIQDTKINIDREKENIESITSKLNNLYKVEINIKEFELKYNKARNLSAYRDNYHKTIKSKAYNLNIVNSLKDLDKISLKLSKIIEFQYEQDKLSKLNNKLKIYKKEINKLNSRMEKLKRIESIASAVSKIEKDVSYLYKLDKLNARKSNVSKSIDMGNIYYKKLEHLNRSEEKYSVLYEKINTIASLSKLSDIIKDISERQSKSRDYLNKNKQELSKLTAAYRQMLIDQKTCPLCFSEINDEKADYIINQYK